MRIERRATRITSEAEGVGDNNKGMLRKLEYKNKHYHDFLMPLLIPQTIPT